MRERAKEEEKKEGREEEMEGEGVSVVSCRKHIMPLNLAQKRDEAVDIF